MEQIVVVIAFIGLAIIVRLIAGSFDGERVERYMREHGWELVDRSWAPLGPGWFGEKDSRIYQVVYRDTQGNLHKAHVKTSMMSGVYLTHDQVVERPKSSSEAKEVESLAEENNRLKARIRELEDGRA